MKKYLFIVLLVGVCSGQMKVYSEVPIVDTIRFTFEEEGYKYHGIDRKVVVMNKNIVIDGTWLCTNVSNCDLQISWEYLDDKIQDNDFIVKIGSSVVIRDITKLINGIKSLHKYSFKKYDIKAEYQLQNAKLVYAKDKFLELQNNSAGRLKIIEPEKFIAGLENWMTQKPK